MENILYIGPYREFSGMGNAARQYIKALIIAGYNVSIRPIYNSFVAYPFDGIEENILALEKNSSQHYHKIIQHCYPHQLIYNSNFDENIALVHLESLNNSSVLKESFNLVDKIIVGSSFVKKALNDLSVDCPIIIVPEPIDYKNIEEYRLNNPIEIQNNNFRFYTIGSFIDRKNLHTLLMAFLIFSNYYSDVDLSIKINRIHHVLDIKDYIEYEFEKIYSTVRNNFTRKPNLFIGNTVYKNILYLHNNNDCYINTSCGESFGYSALEAMCFNNNLIVTDNTGFDDIVDDKCGLKVASELVYAKDKDRIFPIYNSVYQKWYECKIDDLIDKMSIAINESKISKKERISYQNEKIKQFTMQAVADRLVKL